MRSESASTKASWMPSVTMTREVAVQRWPVEKKALCATDLDRHLEVGVVEHDGRVLAAHLELELAHHLDAGLGHALAGADRAGEGDGVDVRAVEHGLADHRALAHDQVQHALGQPGAVQDVDDGPGAAGHQVRRLEHHGVAVDQSAGAIFQAGMAMGKFHGVMMPTTPTASRVISTPTPGRTDGTLSPVSRSASPAKNSKIWPARVTSPMPSASVLPSSRLQQRGRARPCGRRSRARSCVRMPQRSRRPERDQAGKAALAAAMAVLRLLGASPAHRARPRRWCWTG